MLNPALSLALMIVAGGAQASPQDEQEATSLPSIEVQGDRRTVYEAARSFAGEVLVTPPRRGVARWDSPVCTSIMNMRRDAAQGLADRIADRVRDLGLEAGEPGCTPNVVIVAADDGAAMAGQMVGAEQRAFRPGFAGSTLTNRALRTFRTSDAPVRWWQLTVPIDPVTGGVTSRTRDSDPEHPIARRIDRATRLRTFEVNRIYRVMIIVDANRIGAVDVGQLGDYLSMVILAQVDPEANVAGFETVLNLFLDPTGVSGMTNWDRTYLRELYSADLSALHTSHQLGTIAGAMARNVDDEAE